MLIESLERRQTSMHVSVLSVPRRKHRNNAEDAPRQALLDTTLLEITPMQLQKGSIESVDHRIGDVTRSQPQSNACTTLL